MKCLIPLLLCCLVNVASNVEQTVDVPVPIIVDDNSPISLSPSDLKVEVRSQPVNVTSITPLAEQGLQYVLLNDASGRNLWPNGMKQQSDAADQLLKQVIMASSDIGSLVNFSDQAVHRFHIDAQNENDPQKLAAKLERSGSGATGMYDAVVSAAKWLGKQDATPARRKVIFLFCDGGDTASRSSLDDATEALQRTRVPIFIVAPGTTTDGEKLRRLASSSGGRVYFFSIGDRRQVKFDLLKRDLGQSFLMKISVPYRKANELLPVTITDVSNPRIPIIGPSQIAVPK
jgi:hypothetical protein